MAQLGISSSKRCSRQKSEAMFIKWAKSAQMYVQKLLLLVLLLSDLNGSQHRLIQPLVIKPSGLIQPLPLDTLH